MCVKQLVFLDQTPVPSSRQSTMCGSLRLNGNWIPEKALLMTEMRKSPSLGLENAIGVFGLDPFF